MISFVDPALANALESSNWEEELDLIEIREAQDMAKKAGLIALVKADEDRLKRSLLERKFETVAVKPLDAKERETWSRWLPFSYRSDQESWSRYQFDFIPLSIRRLIVDLKQKRLFDFLEIRTQERLHLPDPALFGYLGDKVYLLARWGESDEYLLSYEEISRGVAAQNKAEGFGVLMGLCNIIGAFGLFYALIALGYQVAVGHHQSELAATGGFTLLSGCLASYFRWLRSKVMRHFPYAFRR